MIWDMEEEIMGRTEARMIVFLLYLVIFRSSYRRFLLAAGAWSIARFHHRSRR
jgi:hypothetical protein